MKLICKEVKSAIDAKGFVVDCENEFQNKLKASANRALSLGNRIITLAGPTCSGKTTTASILVDEIEKAGKKAIVISIDDFYLDDLRVSTNATDKQDFDSVTTIDLPCLSEVVNGLFNKEIVQIPKFDFKTGKRCGFTELAPTEDDIYIFEGIQAVYPEVVELFGDRYTSVFISVNDDIMFNGVYFSKHEIRLLRRIVRDSLFRNTTPDKTLEYWASVRENEENSIFPNSKNPNISIDSFLMYELFIIAPIASVMLKQVLETSQYYDFAKGLIIRLDNIDGTFFDKDLVPYNSMFREFIG